MMGVIGMVIGCAVALFQGTEACKRLHPGITDRAALELTMRPQGCK